MSVTKLTPDQIIKTIVDKGIIRVDQETGYIFDVNEKQIRPTYPDQGGGYARINKFGKSLYVHRIVAYAKFGDKALEKGMHIHHKDTQRHNNAGHNLELKTKSRHYSEGSLLSQMKWGVYTSEGCCVGLLTERSYADILLETIPKLQIKAVLGRKRRNTKPKFE